jgi:hypothetical protein
MEKSSQRAWKIVPLRHFFPLKVVPLIEVLLYQDRFFTLMLTICSSVCDLGCSAGVTSGPPRQPVNDDPGPQNEEK